MAWRRSVSEGIESRARARPAVARTAIGTRIGDRKRPPHSSPPPSAYWVATTAAANRAVVNPGRPVAAARPPPADEQEAEEGERPGRHQAGDRLVGVGGEAEDQQGGGATDTGRQQQARAVGPAAEGEIAQADRHHQGQQRERSGRGVEEVSLEQLVPCPGYPIAEERFGSVVPNPLVGVGAVHDRADPGPLGQGGQDGGHRHQGPGRRRPRRAPLLEADEGQRRGQGGGEQEPFRPQQRATDDGGDGQDRCARGDASAGDAGGPDEGEPGHCRARGVGPHDVAADQDGAGHDHPEGGAGQPGIELPGQEPGRYGGAEDAEQPGHVQAERLPEGPRGAQEQEGVAGVLDVRVVAAGALVAEDDREGVAGGVERGGLVLVRPRALVQGPHLDGVGTLVRGERAGRAHQGQQGHQDDGQGGGVCPQGQPPRPPDEGGHRRYRFLRTSTYQVRPAAPPCSAVTTSKPGSPPGVRVTSTNVVSPAAARRSADPAVVARGQQPPAVVERGPAVAGDGAVAGEDDRPPADGARRPAYCLVHRLVVAVVGPQAADGHDRQGQHHDEERAGRHLPGLRRQPPAGRHDGRQQHRDDDGDAEGEVPAAPLAGAAPGVLGGKDSQGEQRERAGGDLGRGGAQGGPIDQEEPGGGQGERHEQPGDDVGGAGDQGDHGCGGGRDREGDDGSRLGRPAAHGEGGQCH